MCQRGVLLPFQRRQVPVAAFSTKNGRACEHQQHRKRRRYGERYHLRVALARPGSLASSSPPHSAGKTRGRHVSVPPRLLPRTRKHRRVRIDRRSRPAVGPVAREPPILLRRSSRRRPHANTPVYLLYGRRSVVGSHVSRKLRTPRRRDGGGGAPSRSHRGDGVRAGRLRFELLARLIGGLPGFRHGLEPARGGVLPGLLRPQSGSSFTNCLYFLGRGPIFCSHDGDFR
mmetsp:Transcript_27891/g.63863  ORF Transcript_27891/g.63863 Transcript_27891/m.63863 type:complete len:229 (+) Transcript_27891:542-1228(+)